MMPASIASKIVLITGANQGIGFEIAKSLSSKQGYHVLMGSRDPSRGIKAAKQLQDQGLDVESITIDVTSDESLVTAVKEVTSKFSRLDVLINNAGVSMNETNLSGSALRQMYHDTFDVNVFGAALTTEAFIPLLRSSPAPRIVFISSTTGSLAYFWNIPVDLPVYRSSKTAMTALMRHYAFKFKDEGWKVNATCPGHCATNLNEFHGTDTPQNGAINAVRLATLGDDGETGTFSSREGEVPW